MRPDAGIFLLVFRLLLVAILDLILLPFRLAVFLVRRKKVQAEIKELVTAHRTEETSRD
ncbi:MAG: hypothetical protein ACYTG7_07730 [Planctomycetota bacterium]